MEFLHLIASALAVCVGLLLLLFAGIYVGWVGGSMQIASQSTRWPTVDGVVTKSEVRANRSANGLPGYRYILTYTYSIGGEQHEGSLLSGCVSPYSTRRWATKRLAPYPTGAKVQVRYAPDESEISVLEPGWTLEALYPVGTLIAVTVLGLAATVWGALHGWATLFG
jgi:hypothetical protein